MAKRTEWAVELSDEWGDIVVCEYFRTEREAREWRDRNPWPGMVQLARVTEHWDGDSLVSRDYDYTIR